MTTFTSSSTATFTVTHARHLASKVTADMNVCRRYYGKPAQTVVDEYNEELTELLRFGYIDQYEFGFKKDGRRVLSWRYCVDSSGSLAGDDRAGKLLPSADIAGCDYFNTIWRSADWWALTDEERNKFDGTVPVTRSPAATLIDGSGYWTGTEKSYYAGGTGVTRSSFRPY